MHSLEEGINAYGDSNYARAFEILKPFAESGNVDAQKIIASMYLGGQGVPANWEIAVQWCRKAAEQGDPVAQNNLATFLLGGEYPEEVIYWFTESAKQGFPFAMESLGDICSGRLKVPGAMENQYKDESAAIQWYRKAAAKGSPTGYHRLGDIYANGQGVVKHEQKAVACYKIAANAGYSPSQKVLAEAYRQGLLGLARDLGQAQYWLDRMKIQGG